MNKTVRVRLSNVQIPPAPPDGEVREPGDDEKCSLMFTGPIQLQWPVTYADLRDGMVTGGDLYEITITKVPAVGRRIGEAPRY